MKKRTPVFSVISFLIVSVCNAQTINTIAGNGTAGSGGDGAAAAACQLDHPIGVAVDGAGNVFVADRGNSRIRKITSSGIISTVAGTSAAGYSGDGGPATAASLSSPVSVVVDAGGNLYIADLGNQRVRKVSNTGIISTYAGTGTAGNNGVAGPATTLMLNDPRGVAVNSAGDLLITDQGNNRVLMIDASGLMTVLAGTGTIGYSGDGGPATAAQFNGPYGLATDGLGNTFVCDVDNERIRRISPSGIITTIAGNGTSGYSGDFGPATAAQLSEPIGVAVDAAGNLYVADGWNERIRQVNTSGKITTIAGKGSKGFSGDGGFAGAAEFADPYGIALDNSGNMYIADYTNNRIRYITHPTSVSSVAEKYGIRFSPNPCKDKLLVSIASVVDEDVRITITDMSGRMVSSMMARTNHPAEMDIRVPHGLYCLSATTNGVSYVQKFIVAD